MDHQSASKCQWGKHWLTDHYHSQIVQRWLNSFHPRSHQNTVVRISSWLVKRHEVFRDRLYHSWPDFKLPSWYIVCWCTFVSCCVSVWDMHVFVFHLFNGLGYLRLWCCSWCSSAPCTGALRGLPPHCKCGYGVWVPSPGHGCPSVKLLFSLCQRVSDETSIRLGMVTWYSRKNIHR